MQARSREAVYYKTVNVQDGRETESGVLIGLSIARNSSVVKWRSPGKVPTLDALCVCVALHCSHNGGRDAKEDLVDGLCYYQLA